MSLLHGKQIQPSSIVLDKLSGTGSVVLQNGAIFQIPLNNITVPSDVVNKEYVDALSAGIHPHASVSTVTTGNLNLISATTSPVINGYTMSGGDRVLVWMQTITASNGIYLLTQTVGGTFSRSYDMDGDPNNEIQVGDYTFVTDGYDRGNGYVIIGGGPTAVSGDILSVDVDPIIWTEFIGPGNLTWGNGLSITETTIDIELAASSGLTFSGSKLTVDSNIAGDGLNLTTGILNVNTSNGLSILSDSVALGGTLSQDTTIIGDNRNLVINDLQNYTISGSGSVSMTHVNTNNSLELNDAGYITLGTNGTSWGDTFIGMNPDVIEIQNFGTGDVRIQNNGTGDTLVQANGTTSDLKLSTSYHSLDMNGTTSSITNNGSNNSMIINDGLSNKGLVYTTDYSANFTPESLVSKRYVDSAVISSGLTATNGLTETSTNVVALGGTLSQNTSIYGDGYDLTIGGYDNLIFASSIFDVSSDMVIIDGGTGSVDIYSNLDITLISTLGDINILGSASNITTSGLKGLVYTSDYSATFVTQSLVTKGYVDASVGLTAGTPVYTQRNLTPVVTSGNGASSSLSLSSTPKDSTNISVYVNGSLQYLGDGITTGDCYFGTQSGTAVTITSLISGYTLFWNGTNAGFDLSTTDKVDIIYNT